MSHLQVLSRRAWEINYNTAQGNVNLPDTRATDQSEASHGLWSSVPLRPRVMGFGDVIQERGKRGKEPGKMGKRNEEWCVPSKQGAVLGCAAER